MALHATTGQLRSLSSQSGCPQALYLSSRCQTRSKAVKTQAIGTFFKSKDAKRAEAKGQVLPVALRPAVHRFVLAT